MTGRQVGAVLLCKGGGQGGRGGYEGSKASLKHSYPEVGEGVALKVKNPFESSPNIIPFLSCFRGIEYFFGHLAHGDK